MLIEGKKLNLYSLGSRRKSRVGKKRTLKEVSTLGSKGINMLEVDLSCLLGRKSFTILYTLSCNRYRVNTIILANFKVNAYGFLNTKCAKKIVKFLHILVKTLERPILIKGYNS